MTFFVMKNVDKKSEKKEDTPILGESTQWEHIKDFSDINSAKQSKVNVFTDEFDDDVKTVGADFSDFAKSKMQKSNPVPNTFENKANDNNANQNQFSNSFKRDDFINDYMTMSIDDADEGDDDDETMDINSVQAYKEPEATLDVILKYKDVGGVKMQKIETSQVTVGRGIGNDLLFRSDSFTSRNHAIFTIRNNELYLKDLNSKNGTFINKTQKVEGEVRIDESCEVTFGDVIVEVIIKK
jgi:hypothetical protein